VKKKVVRRIWYLSGIAKDWPEGSVVLLKITWRVPQRRNYEMLTYFRPDWVSLKGYANMEPGPGARLHYMLIDQPAK
jgi:hypothetical protein